MMWEFFSHDSIRLPLNPSLEVVGIDYKVDWLIGHGVVIVLVAATVVIVVVAVVVAIVSSKVDWMIITHVSIADGVSRVFSRVCLFVCLSVCLFVCPCSIMYIGLRCQHQAWYAYTL